MKKTLAFEKLLALVVVICLSCNSINCDNNHNKDDKNKPKTKPKPAVTTVSTTTTASSAVNRTSKGLDLSSHHGHPTHTDNILIKFLTSHTKYPVRLTDHTAKGSGGHAKWYKHGCECYLDELNNSTSYYSYETDPIEQDGPVNLFIIKFDPVQTTFLLDHYEPRHQKSTPKDDLYDYDYHLENNPDLYTVIYLSSFDFIKNETSDEETEISCRVSLTLPSGIKDEHTENLKEKLKTEMTLTFELYDSQEPIYVDIKSSTMRKRTVDVPSVRHKRFEKREVQIDSKLSLYELVIIEGPLKFYRSNFDEGLNASCNLKLRDYDNTIAYNQFRNISIFPSRQTTTEQSSSSSAPPDSLRQCVRTSLFCFSWVWLLLAIFIYRK